MTNKIVSFLEKCIPVILSILAIQGLYLIYKYNNIIDGYRALNSYEYNMDIMVISNRLTGISIQSTLYVISSLLSGLLILSRKENKNK